MRTKTKNPQFVRYFAPIVEVLKELGGSARPAEVCNLVATRLTISDDERAVTLDSGMSRFDNQVHWARFYLAKAGYIDNSKRGMWSLTEQGQTVDPLSVADATYTYRKVQNFFKATPADEITPAPETLAPPSPTPSTPLPQDDYRTQLLTVLRTLPPAGFERLCQRLLRESGFEQVFVTGRSGDGGIDGHGVLQINPFVSFKVLFQCKRYAGSVSTGQVRDFRGAMMGRADKGIIITTGSFTADAQREAIRDGASPIELVPGEKLLDMFENLELGLIPRKTYDLDIRFFEPFQV